jgi:hypothetical protein
MRQTDDREEEVPRRSHHLNPNLASVRVIFIIHRNEPKQPGSDSGLGVTVNGTVRVLRQNGVDAQSWGLKDAEQLSHRLETDEWAGRRPITHVIINTPNFTSPHKFGELALRWPDIRFVMLNHTGLAYMSIDDNGPRKIRELLHLHRSIHNVQVAGNNKRFGWFEVYGVRPLYLPNLFDCGSFVDPVTHRKDPDPLRIGSFGENRPWKNQSIAAMAALSIARRMGVQLELFVNQDRWEQSWPFSQPRRELFDHLPWAKIVTVPWASWSTFRQTVGMMDLCIHPSFDETFCSVVADSIAEAVPSVTTAAMEWTPRSWQAEPFDPASVAAVGSHLLHNPISAVHEGREHLRDFVRLGVERWVGYLAG